MGLLVALLVAFLAAGYAVYVHPRTDSLRKADAIFVLGGYSDGNERQILGAKLNKEGWAPNLVISNPTSRGSWWWERWCKYETFGTAGVLGETFPNKFCPIPEPGTTQGEARTLRDLAREHGWHTVIVVTFRPHIDRARLLLQRCFTGDLIMVESPAQLTPVQWAYEFLYQTGGFIKAAFNRDC